MADFSINADLILQPAKNVNQVAQQTAQQFNSAFQSALGSSSGANKAADDLARLRKQTQELANSLLGVQAGSKQTKNVLDDIGAASAKVTGNVKNAAGAIENFGRQSALAIRRYAAFVLAARGVFSLGKDIDRSINEAISFNRELVKLAQIGNQSISSLRGVNDEITKLSTSFGTSSEDLIKVEVSLRRMGLSATDAKKVLEGLAEASLSASFEDIKSAAEGTTAVMNEFGIKANQVKDILGSMNAVANKFGTSFEDIFTAVKKSGEVFSQAGGGLNSPIEKFQQFLAIFATAKSTTQEGANSIASSLKILTGKLVQQSTIDTLRQYNIELTDLKGNFVGDYEALRRLSEGLNRLGRGSVSLFKAADLGGYEQLNKVLPLLVNFDKASEAYKTAQQGAGSVSKDAAIAQQALAVQLAKVREEFNALIRNLGQSETFKAIAKLALDTASAFIKLVDSIKELVPLLALIGAVKLVQYAPTFARGFRDTLINNVRPSFNAPAGKTEGGLIPGFGGGDSVPIMAERGEYIINKDAARKIGYRRLNQLNVRGYITGGEVPKGFQVSSPAIEQAENQQFATGTEQIIVALKKIEEALSNTSTVIVSANQKISQNVVAQTGGKAISYDTVNAPRGRARLSSGPLAGVYPSVFANDDVLKLTHRPVDTPSVISPTGIGTGTSKIFSLAASSQQTVPLLGYTPIGPGVNKSISTATPPYSGVGLIPEPLNIYGGAARNKQAYLTRKSFEKFAGPIPELPTGGFAPPSASPVGRNVNYTNLFSSQPNVAEDRPLIGTVPDIYNAYAGSAERRLRYQQRRATVSALQQNANVGKITYAPGENPALNILDNKFQLNKPGYFVGSGDDRRFIKTKRFTASGTSGYSSDFNDLNNSAGYLAGNDLRTSRNDYYTSKNQINSNPFGFQQPIVSSYTEPVSNEIPSSVRGSRFPTFKKFFNRQPNIPPAADLPSVPGEIPSSEFKPDKSGRFKNFGYGALIAADVAAPIIANSIGRDTPGAAGTGGAITGAAAGASIGFVAGPYGAAIGAAVGAITGFTENFKQAQLDVAFKRLGSSTSELNETIERFAKGIGTPANVVSGFRNANVSSVDLAKTVADQAGPGLLTRAGRGASEFLLDPLSGSFAKAGINYGALRASDQGENVRNYQRFREQYTESGQKVFDASGDQRAGVANFLAATAAKGFTSSQTIDEARKAGLDDRTLALAGKGGKNIATEEQKILQSGKDAAREQYELARLYEYGAEATKKEYEANDEAIKKQNELADAIKLADNGVTALVYSLDKLGHAAERANVVGQIGGARAETAFGQATNPGQFALGKTGPLFSAISNTAAFSPEQVKSSLGQLQRSLGVGPEFGAGLLQGRQVREVLPGILEKYSGKGVEEASTGITKDIQGLGLGKELTAKLVSEVNARLTNNAGPNAVKNLVNDKAFTENIGGNIDKAYQDNFKKFVDSLNAAQDQYKAGLEKYYSAELDIEKKKLDTEEQTFKYGLERSKLANPLHFIAPDEARAGLLQRVGSLTGGATTAAGITANLSPLVAQRADVQRQLGNAGLTNEERTKLLDQEAQLTLSINKNTTGLELLARSTDGLAQINEAYNRIQEQRQVGKGLISTALNASPEQALQLRRGFAGVRELEGGRTNFGIQQLRDIRSALDVSLPAYAASQDEATRKKGANLEARFNQVFAQNFGLNLNSNNPLAEAIKASTTVQGESPAERVLIAKFDEFTKAQTDAQKAITDFSKQNLAEPLNIIKTTLQEQLIILRAEAIKNGVPLPRGQGRAMGGLLPGFGGGDRIPIMAEGGEFVINKHSTAANLELLQEINQGYAVGGRVRRRRRQVVESPRVDLLPLGDRTLHHYAVINGHAISFERFKQLGFAKGYGNVTNFGDDDYAFKDKNLPHLRSNIAFQQRGANPSGGHLTTGSLYPQRRILHDNSFSRGGFVRGYAAGGQVTSGGGGEAFIQSMTRFENAVNKLAQIHIPDTIQMNATHSVDVVINGASVFNQMKPEIADMILGYVKEEMRRYINPVTGETEEHQQYNYGGGG